MSMFDSIGNRGEYFSAHYFAERLGADLKKGLFDAWTRREGDEHDQRLTARQMLRSLRGVYLTDEVRGFLAARAAVATGDGNDGESPERAFTYGDPGWVKQLAGWHGAVLRALGFEAPEEPVEVAVHRAGRTHAVRVAYSGQGVLAVDCGWAHELDSALDESGAGRLLHPVPVTAAERYETGSALASWLFHSNLGSVEGEPPRFIVLLIGGVIVLADRNSWGEGRYLAANLDAAFHRNDRSQGGELALISALFSRDMLTPGENGEGPAIDALLKASAENAVGVSSELRHGLQRSVEVIANEVLSRMKAADVSTALVEKPGKPIARQLKEESLRYLYRILFLLYAEARPELGILPADDDTYEAGYSMARLRELVARDAELTEQRTRDGFHLYESLDMLFTKVNFGHRERGKEEGDDLPGDDEETRKAKAARRSEERGLRFEPLRSTLFEPSSITLIGREVATHDDRVVDLRLRNETLHEVLRLLTMKKGKRGERGGFISYRNLGINQLGAVYEGLMSYTGFIAEEELYEVAKKGDPKDGSWMVPQSRIDQYADEVFVQYGDEDNRKGLRGRKRYAKGCFVYRLAGRDRQTSASYYTPESLTKVTVELTLQHRLDQEKDEAGEVVKTPASDLLKYKICEPALGSGAFLNEAINQVAAEYLKRRQEELGVSVPTSKALEELQKVKAYIALHNAYGVDLNATGVELAEVSLWLNTMHPGMRAPWFGLHLRRGNSLIGGRRAVYSGADVASKAKAWLKAKGTLPPTELPFLKDGERQGLPEGAVHQFLLPAVGWAAVAGEKEAKALAPEQAEQLAKWKKGILKAPTTTGGQKSQLARLQAVARRAEFLWDLVLKRMEISEREIARKVDVWGADPDSPEFSFMRRPEHPVAKEKVYQDLFEAKGTPYWRLKTLMDTWCALWFWPLDKAGLLDGTAGVYERVEGLGLLDLPQFGPIAPVGEALPLFEPRFSEQTALFVADNEQTTIFSEPAEDEDFVDLVAVGKAPPKNPKKPKPLKPVRRPTIPLKDFADWLDFAEALLGSSDVQAGTLIETFDSLADLEQYEDDLPGYMAMDPDHDLPDRFPWLATVENIAQAQGFFHWELNFGLIFTRDGGFDLQVGNPPWVRPTWDESSVLAEFDPWFTLSEDAEVEQWREKKKKILENAEYKERYAFELSQSIGLTSFIGNLSTYVLLAGTQPDLYRAFMVRVWANLAGRKGRAGLIHPDTHFGGVREGNLRRHCYRRLRVHAHFSNLGAIFPEIRVTRQFGINIYGDEREVSFIHASWLFSAIALTASFQDDSSQQSPGMRYQGRWDARAHRERLIHVNDRLLSEWRKLFGDPEWTSDETPLLYPISSREQAALGRFAESYRLQALHPQITSGLHEKGAKESGIIRRGVSTPSNWSDVILRGPHFSNATPFSKQAPDMGRSGEFVDLTTLPPDGVPATDYQRACSREVFSRVQDNWNGRPNTEYFRLAWRSMIPFDTERSLFAAIIPPGPSHVHAIYSMALRDNRATVLAAGFWASLPLDYLLRITGRSALQVAEAMKMPAPVPDHPLANALLIRTLRLNCLTQAYAPLWNELFEATWPNEEGWAVEWPFAKRAPLCAGLVEVWDPSSPLRSEFERRAVMVEIDALIAVWLGITADQISAIYQGRYPVLFGYESETYFDSAGRKIAKSHDAFGYRQTKQHYEQLLKHLDAPRSASPPEGYGGPFYRADREREMREAHSAFQARLDLAVAAGKWGPIKQEVPAADSVV
ncbi:hypothetical protein ACWGR4_14100 [Embleya sp. NPDC055664]